GTGSGALGITASLELPSDQKVRIDLIDIDPKVLKVAKTNVDLLTTGISTTVSDLLEGSQENYDVLLCNLPYVPDEHPVNKAATHEPDIALYSGKDGLNHYRRLLNQIGSSGLKPLYL